MRKYIFVILGSAIALGLLFFYQTGKFSDKKLHFVVCDVGQGDGIYIRTAGEIDIIIDGGRKNGKMLDCLSKYMPIADRQIELVFATHPDADHIGGLVDVLESYKVLSFNTSSASKSTKIFAELQALIKSKQIPFREISEGDSFTLSDGTKLETKWPIPEFESEDTNEHSLVQILSYGNFRALLTGDVTYQILNTLSFPETFDVFKIPHHGSKTGVDDRTLAKIRAYFVAISLGKNNSYHHPHPSVISLLKKHQIPFLRTDEVGSIEVVTDGKNTKVVN
ncbi:MAG: hypothetical protein A2776_03045 [Candidatus Levybacteria bacterium RIFCSPHIGHO2_01_FULL_40_10]|nr:MAG: hypothetical protein A2776_03045 [Candidatus Levybacteria bacterium RIFCSPHIGHO2_01_FULL_40_10]